MSCDICGFEPCECLRPVAAGPKRRSEIPPLLLHIPKTMLTPQQRAEIRREWEDLSRRPRPLGLHIDGDSDVYAIPGSLGPVAETYSALVKAATTGDLGKLGAALKDLKDAVVWAEGEIGKS